MTEILQIFTVRDLFDILAVALFIYGIIYFLVVTRGLQILQGLMLIGLFWLLAEVLQFNTLSWIFEKLWTVGLFSIVVIFQPEIRKALARISEQTKMLRIFTSEEMLIDKIVRACRFMSDRQIGALIVIERNTSLDNIVEGCVNIDAQVTVELLITIFYPMTPLHDGAVVIRNDRVVYASCVLPLSRHVELPKKYGTRHRAAIGITEESDAIAIVVSEETGEISVAKDGNLERNLDPEILRDILMKELGVKHEKD